MRVRYLLALAFSAGCSTTATTPTPTEEPAPASGSSAKLLDAHLCAAGNTTAYAHPTGQVPAALSLCGDLQQTDILTIDPRTDDKADLLVDGSSYVKAPLNVAGSMFSQGTIITSAQQIVGGDVHTGGDWDVSGQAQVGNDAYVSGTLDVSGTDTVDGVLYAAKVVGGSVTATTSTPGPVQFASPLDCSAISATSDVIAASPADSAAEAALAYRALEDVNSPTTVTLGCGRYRISSIGATASLRVNVVGPTVLVVDGDVHIGAETTFDLADGATLQLLVGGALETDALLVIGSPRNPAVIMVQSAIRISAPTRMYGYVIARDTFLTVDDDFEIWGSATVGQLQVHAPMMVHDRPQVVKK